MRWILGAVLILATEVAVATEPPLALRVIDSSDRPAAVPRVILPSRDPERPCLVLEPVVELTLVGPSAEPGFWENQLRTARLLGRLRDHLRSWRGLSEFELMLPPVDA